MATEEVMGYENQSKILPKDIEAQASSEDMNIMTEKQDQELESDTGHDDDDEVDEATKSLYYQLPVEDEAQRLLKEIKAAMEQVKESKFYANLTEQIEGEAFQRQLRRVLEGSDYFQLEMVIYALGGLEFDFNPHHQLAIALLLKQDFCSWIGKKIQVFDPVFSPADVIVLKELGCEVLSVNERCRRKVEKPTLFYMPHAEISMVGDLLGANWCPSRINRLILLDVSFNATCGVHGKHSKTEFFGRSEDYIHAIKSHTKEIFIEPGYGGRYDGIFYNFAFHFFEVDSQLDMDKLIPDEDGELSKMRLQHQRESDERKITDFFWEHKCAEEFFMEPFAEDAPKEDWAHLNGAYRGPRRFRCSWSPPPRGWMKLNFGGRSSNNLAGFGGICHNESKEPILIYKGALCKVDQTAACVEALMFGLTELLKVPNLTRNLIVEGDDIRVIQWANKRQHEVPEGLEESLKRVLELLKEFNSVIYHIYEEANLVANNLAEEGAASGNHVYLAGQNSEESEEVENLTERLKLVG